MKAESIPIKATNRQTSLQEPFGDPSLREAASRMFDSSHTQLSESFSRSDGVRPISPDNLTGALISPNNFFSSLTANGLNQKAFSLLVPKEIQEESYELETKTPAYERSMSDGSEPEKSEPLEQADISSEPKIRGELGKLLKNPRQNSQGPPSISITPLVSEARILKPTTVSASSSSSSSSAPNHFFEKFKVIAWVSGC